MAEHFSLRWNNFHRNMSSGFRTLLMEDSLVDVTLAADGHFIQAHRLVLSVCSPYFKNLFSTTPCNHPIVIMKDVHFKQLTDILSFMYQGEVNVHQEELADFLKTAELLQIRGLAEQNAEDVNSATLTQLLSKSSCSDRSEIHLSSSSSVLKQETQPRVKVSQVARATLNQRHPSQEEIGATDVPVVAASLADAQAVLHQSAGGSSQVVQSRMRGGPSTAMFVGVQVKEELPDVPSDAEQEVDSYEYMPGDKRASETDLADTSVILHDGDSDHPQVTEKSLCSASSAQSGARKLPVRSLSSSGREGEKSEPPKMSRHRKQRTIALNKIRRFLVTPKRSRRIAFARKMKMKKQVILKSGLSADNISDVSKQLTAISRNSTNIKNSGEDPSIQDFSRAAPATSLTSTSKNQSEISLGEVEGNYINGEDNDDAINRQSKGEDTQKFITDEEDSKKKIDTTDKKKIRVNPSDGVKKYRNLSSEVKKDDPTSDTKNKRTTSSTKNTEGGNEIHKRKTAVKLSNNTPINKKKIIVVIAAKKTKSAVALARKMQSPVRDRPTMANRHGSMKRTASGATIHLRSSTPLSNSSLKDSPKSMKAGQACRHLGCLGCRGGN